MDTLVWSATNLIAALILPPCVFFVLLAVGLLWGWKRRWGRWLIGGSLVAFVLLTRNAADARWRHSHGGRLTLWRIVS